MHVNALHKPVAVWCFFDVRVFLKPPCLVFVKAFTVSNYVPNSGALVPGRLVGTAITFFYGGS